MSPVVLSSSAAFNLTESGTACYTTFLILLRKRKDLSTWHQWLRILNLPQKFSTFDKKCDRDVCLTLCLDLF